MADMILKSERIIFISAAPTVLIGTPGRIAWHLRREIFKTDKIHTLVLDEFDKALEFGFREDMDYIIGQLTGLKKRILTSATKMDEIPDFTGINNPAELNFSAKRYQYFGVKT